jgi:hypothetical protein
MTNIEYVLYGIPKGETERYSEVILLSEASDAKRVEKVKELAGKDGFHGFRLARIDLTVAPNFGRNIFAR